MARRALLHRRTVKVVVRLSPEDAADLQRCADAWATTRPTAAWMVLRERFAAWRGIAPAFGTAGLVAAASAATLGLVLARPVERRGRWARPAVEDLDE